MRKKNNTIESCNTYTLYIEGCHNLKNIERATS